MSERFRDPGDTWTTLLTEDVLVRCPDCAELAVVVLRPGAPSEALPAFAPRRLVCATCGHTADWTGGQICRYDDARDPYFGLPLWLQARCAGGRLLWAYGRRHLDLLEHYVAARLRERDRPPGTQSSLAERLPTWIKAARNRQEILKAIALMRHTLR